MKVLLFVLVCAGNAVAQGSHTWTYWIQPCTSAIARDTGCHPGDPELGIWALEAWRKAAGGALAVRPATDEQGARLRLYWANGREKLYGETRPISVNKERGAEVYVLPTIAGAGDDPVLRDAIVYLTCLHEAGHAFGLPHTRNFDDIMYSFQYGGDVPAYFARYRDSIANRTDIRAKSGLSQGDRAALMAALP